jgi:ferredoxin
MVPYKEGLTIPFVNPDICVGCGGCEYVCPAKPYKAIHVEGNVVHQLAQALKETEKKKVKVENFGF